MTSVKLQLAGETMRLTLFWTREVFHGDLILHWKSPTVNPTDEVTTNFKVKDSFFTLLIHYVFKM